MFSKYLISKNSIINFFICFIPVTFITGNLLLNLNILLLLIAFFSLFKLDIFKFQINLIDKLIIIFFLYVFINGVINNYFNFNYANEKNVILIKALAYTRFLILYFIFRYLIHNNFINYKLLFLSFGFLALFVSVDIIFQFFFRVDFFGFEAPIDHRRLAGPFGDEWIAGSFIQRFYLFLVFYFLIFSKFKKDFTLNYINSFILFLSFLGVMMSGNRIPAVMFILSLFLIMIFEKSLRRNLAVMFVVFFTSIYFFINNNEIIKTHYLGLEKKGVAFLNYYINKYSPNSKTQVKIPNSYVKEIESGIATWQQNKIFGGGIKSFYYNCSKINTSISSYGCSSHPHNYYVQLAAELGLIGLLLTFVIFAFIIIRSLKLFFIRHQFFEKKILLTFTILFLLEIFPFKTTGSFFTTTNATFLFILMPFIVGLTELRK
jgi:hypothetical protein